MHYADSSERDVPGEHRQLMDAALAKDIDKACELLASHYQTTTDSVLKHALLG
jgi:DNA-binding GntR family transcriptional regulator